jgi:MFS family permease
MAGAAFLPFTIIMAGLSRWAGGLLDRFGARLPLIIGPAIAAVGFGLMALTVARGSYLVFLIPVVVLGFGMVISVAPLTTTVINAVPGHQAGVASGINNAVASLASLLAIAIFGAVALGVHNNTLERQAATQPLSAQARDAIAGARGKFAAELTTLQGKERKAAETIVRQSLGASISLVMGLAAALAFAAALCAALTMRPPETRTQAAAKPAGV